MELKIAIICILAHIFACKPYCMVEPLRTFHLIKRCQRSMQSMIELENVASLSECFKIAERVKALALNYSPQRGIKSNSFQQNRDVNSTISFRRRFNRRHFLDQPEEFFNCHALQCPESSDFTTMVNDSRYDYYSLYGNPPAQNNFICAPEIGLFQLNLSTEKYATAYKLCNRTINGSLAHFASEKRTNSFSKLLQDSDFGDGTLKLAYVGLNHTDKRMGFKTWENENLSCFLFRAWAPGHPISNDRFSNSSCVAITSDFTWMTIDCDRKLAYICEIFTSPLNFSLFLDACDIYSDNT